MNKNKVWETKKYYKYASRGSNDMDHPAMVYLNELSKKSKNILDLGCGDGTRLNNLAVPKNVSKTGVDISQTAIKRAKSKYKSINFKVGNLEKLSLKSDSYDLVYSAYVLEHTTHPEKIITEAYRVLAKKGYLLFVAPNFGAPNRTSPVASYSRIKKILLGFIRDFRDTKDLNWTEVKPLNRKYFPDSDTTVEPYLKTLESFLKNRLNMRIVMHSSCWSEELPNAKLHQKFFKVLSKLGIYPFYYWGPHLTIIAQK